MSRKKIAAANWKMNTNIKEGIVLFNGLMEEALDEQVEVVLCAPATHLHPLAQLDALDSVSLGAQNMYPEESGAYTGELSPAMITSAGASHVIIGHSERRQYFNESNQFLAQKLRKALDHNLIPIFCCGEALDIRKTGKQEDYVLNQLKESFESFTESDLSNIIIAYEPIWAIGTGETASPEQAQEMHESIRNFLRDKYSDDLADTIPILYGGSVKPGNAKEIFSQTDVDGGLVGGASLNAQSFAQIVNAF